MRIGFNSNLVRNVSFIICAGFYFFSCSRKPKVGQNPDYRTKDSTNIVDAFSSKEKFENQEQVEVSKDSISFRHFFAENPFKVRSTEFSLLKSIIPKDAKLVREVIPSRQGDSIPDTLIRYLWGNSMIQFISSPYVIRLFDFAAIGDDDKIFKHNIYIGMSYKDFAANFAELKNSKTQFDFVEFEYGEASEFVQVDFEDGILVKIYCHPYTG